jgi:hypothetical protein
MRKLLAGAVCVFAVALGIAAGTATAGNPNTLTLAVFGDAPYLDPSFAPYSEFNATPAFIATINADPTVQETIHVGDIHSGSEPCTTAYDQSIYNLWTTFRQPLVYTPGDNEWSDCTKVKEEPGSDNDNFVTHPNLPLENLAIIRSIFFANPGWTLGQHPMQVVSQANAYDPAHPTDAQYVENVMWEQSKTVFVSLNLPGGSNNDIDPWYAKTHSSPWNPNQQIEMDQRTGADVRWLNAAFAQAEADNAHNVVIIGQADMWDTTDAPSHQSNYEPIVAAMASNSVAYGKPVLYLHRIVVHGSTFPLEWLKLSIDPRAAWENASTPTSWGPFSWERETQTQLTP